MKWFYSVSMHAGCCKAFGERKDTTCKKMFFIPFRNFEQRLKCIVTFPEKKAFGNYGDV